MRQRAEDQLRITERRVLNRDKSDVASHDAHCLAALLVRRCERQAQRRMRVNESTELAAGISAGPEHPHWYFIHP